MDKKTSPAALILDYALLHKGSYLKSILLAVLGVVFGMIPYAAVARMVSAMIGKEGKALPFYLLWCCVAALAYIGKGVFAGISTTVSHEATFLTMKEIRQKLIGKLSRMPMGAILESPSGYYKDVIVDRVESIEVPLAHLVPEMTANILGQILMLIYLIVLDWRLALVSLVLIPVGMAIMRSTMKSYGANYGKSVEIGGRMTNAIVEYMGGIEVIKAFSQSSRSYEKYSNAVNDNAQFFYDWMKGAQWAMSAYTVIMPAVLLTVLPTGSLLFAFGNLPASTFVTVIILSLGVIEPIIAATNFTDNIARIGTVFGQINAVLAGGEIERNARVSSLGSSSVEFRDVSFRYEDAQEALQHISFEIPAGKVTALVGPSGSGKSTAAKLIAGLWDVQEGQILIGGQNVKDIPLELHVDQISYVEQNSFLFDDSILENIRMGRPGATDEEVVQAARDAGCDGFIRVLDHGYQTVVGSAGGHLSGGERQRIAIARAMLKNAPIVILDEATAYMDPENEAIIQNAVAKLVRGKTLLIIAHRLSTITDADRIILMDNGRISAQGTHEELLEGSALYRRMWQAHMGTKEASA